MLVERASRPFRGPRREGGVMLIEALVGILIFSVGILALVAMQAQAFRLAAEAKYRSDASYLANSLIGRIWTDRANIASYAHRQTDTAGQLCQPTGTNSSYNYVTAVWLPRVAAALPGASTTMQQVKVDTTTNQVTVSVCWMSPQDNTPHRHVVTAYINV